MQALIAANQRHTQGCADGAHKAVKQKTDPHGACANSGEKKHREREKKHRERGKEHNNIGFWRGKDRNLLAVPTSKNTHGGSNVNCNTEKHFSLHLSIRGRQYPTLGILDAS